MLDFWNVSDAQLLDYIKTVGYSTLFIIMVIEGPIASIIGAFLASLGIFNIGIIFLLSLSGDVIGDVILYFIGYWGGEKSLKKAQKILKIKDQTIEKLFNFFKKHGVKTIFIVKSTTGLCWITFVAAGVFKMKFSKFFQGSFFGGIIWSIFLVSVGYFFGYAFLEINQYIRYAGIIVFIIFLITMILISIFKKNQLQKFLPRNGKRKTVN